MLHQAAKTVRRCIQRFIGSSDKARQQAAAAIQQQEDVHFRTYLSRIRATELMYMNSRDTYFSSQTILLFDESELAKFDAYHSVSPEVSNDDLIKLIEEDRAYLPLHRHVFLSKGVWYQRIFWPIHAGCSDMPLQPELSDQSTNDLKKYCSKVHKKYSLHSYNSPNSQMNVVHRLIESRRIGSRLSLKLMNPSFWKHNLSSPALRQRKLQVKLKVGALLQQCDQDNMISYRGHLDVFNTPVKSDGYASLGPRSLTCLAFHRRAPTTKYHSQHKTHESTRSQ